ncbi:MAG: biotin--[acetyl-CoA-carboxylase] ligase [Bacteroidota bacterium]|nr:biotin--[acetyl-CoA-carboxylase] ligase [Bacteroidota bacterium]
MDVVNSTNEFAAELLAKENKIYEGTIILANSQTAGKGQRGNTWESHYGKNLTFSIILFPVFLKINQPFMLNKAISLAVNDFIESIFHHSSLITHHSIKWPNDIYVGSCKIAGILIENAYLGNTFKHSIIGMGININQETFSSNIPNPISLKMLTGKDYNIEGLLSELEICIQKRYHQLKSGDFTNIDQDYLNSIYKYGISSEYIYRGEKITAHITGIDPTGSLILLNEDTGEIIKSEFKEIVFTHNS